MTFEFKCEQCGKTSRKKRSPANLHGRVPRFCSQQCHGTARTGTGRGRDRSGKRKFIPNQEFFCESCGVFCQVYRSPSAKTPRFCSLACLGAAQAGAGNPAYVPGPKRAHGGYKRVYVEGRGSVYEHRYVMEQYIGRVLDPVEVVHHWNLDRADNRLENLLLLPDQAAHMRLHRAMELAECRK